MATVFVCIPAYRDAECLPTITDLFAKADAPERLHVGVCWQYQDGSEAATLDIPEAWRAQVQVDALEIAESKGPGWAKHRAQRFYKGEDYVLMIDSHMRFAKGWDTLLLKQWAACKDKQAVLSHYPPGYTPPDHLSSLTSLTAVRAQLPTKGGDIRFCGETLKGVPPAPLNGLFAAPGCLFAPGRLVRDVPADPYLYFEQEEMCFAARLYTHGWNIYHPTKVALYHWYDGAGNAVRHKHWSDHPGWAEMNQRAIERRNHLLGIDLARSEEALAEMDRYGHGDARDLEAFAEAAGIDFRRGEVTAKALHCGFIEGGEAYLPQEDAAPAKQEKEQPTPAPAKEQSGRIVSAYINVPVDAFEPASTDVLSYPLPDRLFATQEANGARPEPKLLTDGVPGGVLLVENFASPAMCDYLMDYADRTVGRKLEVVDHDRSSADKVMTKPSSGRITDQVSINAISDKIIPLFVDIYSQRLAPFYGKPFEWFERPQILRYSAGGKYDPHADAEHMDRDTRVWYRSQDRDVSVLLYLNEDYGGGELSFDSLNYAFKPKAGMLVAFPSDHRYLHAARPTTSGTRYVIVSWSAQLGTPRVKSAAPYASTFLHLRD